MLFVIALLIIFMGLSNGKCHVITVVYSMQNCFNNLADSLVIEEKSQENK